MASLMSRLGYATRLVLITLLLPACVSGARVISGFGDVRDGEAYPRPAPHSGIDDWGNPGDPVLAGASGQVVATGEEPTGLSYNTCGKYVVLQHEVPNVLLAPRTTYCHLSAVSVKSGDSVNRGEPIGTTGTTGWRRPPSWIGYEHVHWELMTAGGKSTPFPFTIGCFDPKQVYPTDRLVLTYPVRCKN